MIKQSVAFLLAAGAFLSACGDNAETPCEDVSCSFRGVCAVSSAGEVCACDEGYHAEGLTCIVDGDHGPCAEIECSGHGVCVDEGDVICRCDTGFQAVGLACVADGVDAGSPRSDAGDTGVDPCMGETCSGHGVCSSASGAAVCVCDTRYSAHGLACDPEEENPNLEPVNIPVYDSENSAHCLIPDDHAWSSETLNNPTCRNFYVRPGDYLDSGRVVITASGTETQRRTVSLHNGNDLHPGQMGDEGRANVALQLSASYWTIDRMATMNNSYSTHRIGAGSFSLNRGATHNIFNRIYTTNCGYVMQIRHGAHYNTIQNSFFDGVSEAGLTLDISFITLMDWVSGPTQIFGTKIVHNEFHNFKAIKLHDDPSELDQQFNGTLIDDNIIWFSDDMYTDRDGTPNPAGQWARVEASGIGLKAGSSDPALPVVISNNIYWGGQPTFQDPTDALSNPAPGFSTAYMGSANVQFLNNLVIGTPNGITIADRYDEARGTWNVVMTGNILYQCGDTPASPDQLSSSLRCGQAEGMNVHHNLVREPRAEWAQVRYNYNNNYFGENDVIGIDEAMLFSDNHESVGGLEPADTNHYYSIAEGNAIYTEDYVIHFRKFTNDPQTRVIPNVLRP